MLKVYTVLRIFRMILAKIKTLRRFTHTQLYNAPNEPNQSRFATLNGIIS